MVLLLFSLRLSILLNGTVAVASLRYFISSIVLKLDPDKYSEVDARTQSARGLISFGYLNGSDLLSPNTPLW